MSANKAPSPHASGERVGVRGNEAVYAVLAMRGIRESKQRLAHAVPSEERAALNRWLLDRTLGVVREWLGGMQRCVFISACDEALAIARDAGARVLSETGGAGGHNHAAAEGSAQAVALGARTIVVLPCDLPELTREALDEFTAQGERADFVIAPDEEGTGTNALVLPAVEGLQFFFGPGSLARYVSWGMSRGFRTAVFKHPALAFDIDDPPHYERVRHRITPTKPFEERR